MGVELELKHVSPWCLDRLLEAPAAVETFLLAAPRPFLEPAGPIPVELQGELAELVTHDWRAIGVDHLRTRNPKDYAVISPHLEGVLAEWSQPALDLQKSWRLLNDWLPEICGGASELGVDVLTGGTLFGPDLGYGPARYFLPPEVQVRADALPKATVTPRAAGDPWGQGVLQDGSTWDLYHLVREYYREAAAEGRAMVLAFG